MTVTEIAIFRLIERVKYMCLREREREREKEREKERKKDRDSERKGERSLKRTISTMDFPDCDYIFCHESYFA